MAERLGAADQATEFPQKGYGETEGSPSGEGFPPLAAEPIGKRIDAFNAVSKLVMGRPQWAGCAALTGAVRRPRRLRGLSGRGVDTTTPTRRCRVRASQA